MERDSGCERCGSEVDVYNYCDEDLCIDCIASEQLLVEDVLYKDIQKYMREQEKYKDII
jgi:hypothetical protein